jgi:hypothetical protein
MRAIGLAVLLTVPLAQPVLPLRWSLETRGRLPQAIVVHASDPRYLFVALKNGGVGVFRMSAPDKPPALVATVPRGPLGSLDVMNLFQRGDLLLVALGDFFALSGSRAGLATIDVSNPEAPRVLGRWVSPRTMKGAAAVIADERYAYLAAMSHGVLIFDLADPALIGAPAAIVPDVDFPRPQPNAIQHPNARGLAIGAARRRLYVAYDAGGLRVIDVADPTRPQEIGRYVNRTMGAKQQAYNNLVLDGTFAYVAVDYAGLEVVDVSDPADIRQVGWWNPWRAETPANNWFNSPGHTNQIAFDPKRRLVYLSAGDSELQVVDVSNPRAPRLAANYGEPKNGRGTWGLALGPEHVFLADIFARIPFRGNWSGIRAIAR